MKYQKWALAVSHVHLYSTSAEIPTRRDEATAAPTDHKEAVGCEGRGHDSRHDPRGDAAGEGEPLAGLPGPRRDDLRQPLPRHQGKTFARDQCEAEYGYHHDEGFVCGKRGKWKDLKVIDFVNGCT